MIMIFPFPTSMLLLPTPFLKHAMVNQVAILL